MMEEGARRGLHLDPLAIAADVEPIEVQPAAQLFLFGRPGLRARIDGHEALAEWSARVIVAHHLGGGPEPVVEPDPIARLEGRIAEQEDALRRLLTVMIDWVENGRPARAA